MDKGGRMSRGVRASDEKELPMIERCALDWGLVLEEGSIYAVGLARNPRRIWLGLRYRFVLAVAKRLTQCGSAVALSSE